MSRKGLRHLPGQGRYVTLYLPNIIDIFLVFNYTTNTSPFPATAGR